MISLPPRSSRRYNNLNVPLCICARGYKGGYVFCVLTNAPCSKVSPVFQRWITISIKYDRMSHIADASADLLRLDVYFAQVAAR